MLIVNSGNQQTLYFLERFSCFCLTSMNPELYWIPRSPNSFRVSAASLRINTVCCNFTSSFIFALI